LLLCGAGVWLWVRQPAYDDGGLVEVLRVYGAQGDQLSGTHFNGVAVGDVDGDGYDDLLLTAPESPPDGAAYIVYGRPARLDQQVDLGVQQEGGRHLKIAGDNGDWGLWSIAAGDVNGDGFDDLVIGVSSADSTEEANAGVVYVLPGGLTSPDNLIELTAPHGTHDEFRIHNPEEYYNFGQTVATADLDADGYDDVIILGEDSNPGRDALLVVHGGAEFPAASVDLKRVPDGMRVTSILAEPAGFIGNQLAAGDLNGDGFDDLVFGMGTSDWRHGVCILYGAPDMHGGTVDLRSESPGLALTRVYGETRDDFLGSSIAIADFNGDGFDDLILGAPGAEPQGWVPNDEEVGGGFFLEPPEPGQLGEVYLVYGSSDLPGSTLDFAERNETAEWQRIVGEKEQDRLGDRSAVVDVNADGRSEILVSMRGNYLLLDTGAFTGGDEVESEKLPPRIRFASGKSLGILLDVYGAGGDLDRDGVSEINLSYPLAKGDTSAAGNRGAIRALSGAGDSPSATAIERFQPGNTQSRGFEGRLSPVLRCWIGFTGGDQESPVTLTRSSEGIAEITDLAEVVWEISTPRTGWTNAKIRLQYTDAEIAGLEEDTLALYQAPALSGPWRSVSNAELNSHKNEFTAEVTEFGFFALRGRDAGQA
jgi:hypothetical protein